MKATFPSERSVDFESNEWESLQNVDVFFPRFKWGGRTVKFHVFTQVLHLYHKSSVSMRHLQTQDCVVCFAVAKRSKV
jgi:hypothetical protein